MDDLAPIIDVLDPSRTRALLAHPQVELVQQRSEPLARLPFGRLLQALQGTTKFGVNLSSSVPELREKLNTFLGSKCAWHELKAEADLFMDSLVSKREYMAALAQSSEVMVSLRNYFVPGNLLWHLDHSRADVAYRMVWSVGRPSGLCYTARSNVDIARLEEFYRAHQEDLQRLDAAAFERGEDFETAWKHRQPLLDTLLAGGECFLHDARQTFQVPPDWLSVHRLETRDARGTVHRASYSNRRQPGLQVTIVSWRKEGRSAGTLPSSRPG